MSRSDRRTTQGTFHIVAGGLPVSADKCLTPRHTFVELFRRAMSPPDDRLRFPYTASESQPALGCGKQKVKMQTAKSK